MSKQDQPQSMDDRDHDAVGGRQVRPYLRQCDRIAKKSHRTFVIVTLCGFAAFMLWSSLATFEKVTRGAGRVISMQQNQMVQHLEGGIITAIKVKQGDRVKKDDVLLVVQNSFSEAELSQTLLEYQARLLRIHRLTAESRGETTLTFPKKLATTAPELVKNESRLFARRLATRTAQMEILDDQIRQRQLELREKKILRQGKIAERQLLIKRVESNRRLHKVGAVSRNDVLKLETALQQINTQVSGLDLAIPKTEASLSEAHRRRRDLILRHREAAENERNQAKVELAKLEKAKNAMSDRNKRSEVRAPIAGTINTVFVSTVGGVVRSGQNLVQIVPAGQSIAVEAKLSPKDRAEIWPGLPGIVKVSAYDYSVYGGLKGRITEISPDALQDQKGRPYFRVRMEADVANFGPANPVVPGMLAEIDILTGKHTVLEYLLAPIRRVQSRALRQ